MEELLIKRRRLPKIFFGWWSVLGSGSISLWLMTYGGYGFSALFKPIASELGFSRAVTSVATSISRLEGGVEALAIGWATDRFGPRWIILFGIFLAGLGLILMNFIDSLWAFYVVWGVLLGTGQNLINLPSDTAISNWFVKKRGLALGTKFFITGFSGIIILPLITWLIVTQGWRMTCLIGGVVTLAVGLPIAWFCFKRHRPEYYGLLPDGATAKEETVQASQIIEKGVKYAAEFDEVEFTLRQAIRTPSYWLLIIAIACNQLVFPATHYHGIPFLTDIGMSLFQATGIFALMDFVGLPFRAVGGFLVDRVKKHNIRFLYALAFFLEALGFGIFLLHQTIPMIYAWFIVYGIGHGLSHGLMAAIWGRYFGRKAVGSIRGALMTFVAPVGIAAPIYIGWVYDTTGSYISVFNLVTITTAFSAVLMLLARPPKPPAQVTDIRKIV